MSTAPRQMGKDFEQEVEEVKELREEERIFTDAFIQEQAFMFTASAKGLTSPSMKSFITPPVSSCTVVSSIVFAFLYSASAQEIKLPLKESGAMQKIGYYMPQQLKLSSDRPAGLKKAPEDLVSPLFGEIGIGPKEKPTTIIVAVDEPDDKP